MSKFEKLSKYHELAAKAEDFIKAANHLNTTGEYMLAKHYVGKAKAARLEAIEIMDGL